MYELTEDQAREVGGGLQRVPGDLSGQSLVLPEWDMDRPILEPPDYSDGPEPLPNFGG